MSSLDKSVNKYLEQMRAVGGTGKGSLGEKAVFKICENFYQKEGGILIHSFSYKVDPDKQGNIKVNDQGNHFVERVGSSTEIDILFITKYKVFPIEVKAYKAKEIVLTDERISGCYKTDKHPVHQNEMHMRHLYSYLFRALPDGLTKYVVPVVVFVDECKLIDRRSKWQQEYIKVTNLANLQGFIQDNNKPLQSQINLNLMDSVLKECLVSTEKYLPVRN